jgi:hypothetical protein
VRGRMQANLAIHTSATTTPVNEGGVNEGGVDLAKGTLADSLAPDPKLCGVDRAFKGRELSGSATGEPVSASAAGSGSPWLKPWSVLLARLAAVLLVGCVGFSYSGSNRAFVWAATTVLLASIVASSLHGQHVREKHKVATHTEPVVLMWARPLLRHPAYGSLGKVVPDGLDRLDAARDDIMEALFRSDEWRLLFFGASGTGDTSLARQAEDHALG